MHKRARYRRFVLSIVGLWAAFLFAPLCQAESVVVIIHEAHSLTNDDSGGDDDIYARIRLQDESRPEIVCDLKPIHEDGKALVRRDWTCSHNFADDVEDVAVTIELLEHDSTSADDRFDITPVPGSNVTLSFNLLSGRTTSPVIPGFATAACAPGRLRVAGNEGDDFAAIEFSITSSVSPTGDTDGDGLLDSWERCGTAGVNLPALGADPNVKDVFLEIDWMSAADHTHEPWLPSLINLWQEFKEMSPLSNPDGSDGIRLHIDVGNLYRGYRMNLDTDDEFEIDVTDSLQGGRDMDGDGVNESLDLDGDGVIDIGHLAAVEGVVPPAGEALVEVDTINVPATPNRIFADGGFEFANSFGPDYSAIRSFSSARLGVFRYALFGHTAKIDDCAIGGVAECSTDRGCDELIVSLNDRSDFQSVLDAETGTPLPIVDIDTGLPLDENILDGPTELPVRGTFDEHTAVLMHELGHTFGLRHGGIDDVNFKPNLISVMNYIYSGTDSVPMANEDGDEASSLDQDFNRDTFPDNGRHIYSPTRARRLNEQMLDETQPLFGASGLAINTLDRTAMTSFGPAARDADGRAIIQLVRVDGVGSACPGIDWNRDGICDSSVPADINDLGRNTACGRFPAPTLNDNESLASVSETLEISLRGLGIASENAVHAGIPYDDRDAVRESLNRVRSLDSTADLARQCAEPVRLADFDSLPPGLIDEETYGDWLRIGSSPGGQPTVVSADVRDEMPTSSGDNSLLNLAPASSNLVPSLLLNLPVPARRIGMMVGPSSRSSTGTTEVVLTAFDIRGRRMGRVRKELGPASDGVTRFVGVGSMLPADPIARLEVGYVGVEPDQLVHVDDIMACRQTSAMDPPAYPTSPPANERIVPTRVRANVVLEVGEVGDEPGHIRTEAFELMGVTIGVNGARQATRSVQHTRITDELEVVAPDALDAFIPGATFRGWTLETAAGRQVFFPEQQATVSWPTTFSSTATANFTVPSEQCVLQVNTTRDLLDARVGDGLCQTNTRECSLRAALQEASAIDKACIVWLPAGRFQLTREGREEDMGLTGDLDIDGRVFIVGAGANSTTIDGQSNNDTVLHVLSGASATIGGVTIRGGNGQGYPGGISNDGDLRLSDCSIVDNRSSGNAGGIWNAGTLDVTRCDINDNTAAFNGGGLYNRYGTARIADTTMRGNVAVRFRGGALANNAGTVLVERSSLTDNSALLHGGGLSSDGRLELSNVTISQNRASGSAGLYVSAGTARLQETTIAQNVSEQSNVGGLENLGGTVRMGNSILAGNRGEDGTIRDCAGRIFSLGGNLIENPEGCVFDGDIDALIVDQDPRLLPLAAGPSGSPAGHELAHDSPAIDAGILVSSEDGTPLCTEVDQASEARPIGARCDLGAREYRSF